MKKYLAFNLDNCQSLEAVDHESETQLKVGGNLKSCIVVKSLTEYYLSIS